MKTETPIENTTRALLDAEESRQLAVTRREKKAAALEEAKALVARLREDRDAALRAEDRARIKKATAAIADAEIEAEIAGQAHALALADEGTAAADLARLTAEDQERRRNERVAELRKDALARAARQHRNADGILEDHWGLAGITAELRKLNADDVIQEINNSRLDMRGVPGILARTRDEVPARRPNTEHETVTGVGQAAG
jgi:hypothetical protein